VFEDIRQLGSLSKDGVFVYDLLTEKFVYVNDLLSRIFEINKDELLQQPRLVLPLILSEDAFYLRHRYTELLLDKCVTNNEFRLQFADGRMLHLSLDAYLFTENSTIVGFVKDETLEKEHEDYIINYGAKKDTLLDMMTHNLSGPLQLTQNILRWMQQTYKHNAPGDINAQLLMIQNNTQECLDIINDFLREEHQESERVFVKKSRFDLLERIYNTIDKLMASHKGRRFRIITDLNNLNITTDSVKFFQIVHNLVSNAIKFTPENGQIDILVEETDKTFIVRVRDNGIGIPETLHPELFERNTPARRYGLNQEDSKGMGLSIVKKLTELLDGDVTFESEENKGSTFSVELPKD
jgi:two-component system sensor histidine kinase VicK